MSKKALLIGGGLLLLLLATKKPAAKKTPKNGLHLDPKKLKPMSDTDINKSLAAVYKEFGVTTAKNVEKIYRWETAHFKSDQGRKTFTPGMHPAPLTNDVFPFGWGSALTSFIEKYPQYGGQFGLVDYKESGTGKIKPYIKFPTPEGAFMFVGYIMKNYRSNNRGAWYSSLKEGQDRYNTKTTGVSTPIVNALV